MKKLIIDLRDNPGGILSEVLTMADVLLPEGVIAKITATADDSVNFWAEYANKIFFTSKNNLL